MIYEKKIIILVFVIVLTACSYETPELNSTTSPFIVTSIEQYSESQSHYICAYGGDVSSSLFSGLKSRITLPTGMYNIGDTIIIKK